MCAASFVAKPKQFGNPHAPQFVFGRSLYISIAVFTPCTLPLLRAGVKPGGLKERG